MIRVPHDNISYHSKDHLLNQEHDSIDFLSFEQIK